MIIGLDLVREKLRQVQGFPAELQVLVEHLIVSHHGQYEFGSPKLPSTAEDPAWEKAPRTDLKLSGILYKEKQIMPVQATAISAQGSRLASAPSGGSAQRPDKTDCSSIMFPYPGKVF
jgi:23S rRNA maturation-related 3'-5' exoribonuclease YhaM